MASLTLTGGIESFTWTISGLSWDFNTIQYEMVGICTGSFTNGTTDIPSGIIDYVLAESPKETDSKSVSNLISYTSGTYSFYGFTKTPPSPDYPNGAYWLAGSDTVYVEEEEEEIDRPSNWSWYTTIKSGSEIKLTAREWNDFTSRINAFREYDGLSDYNFTYVRSGVTPISAAICNEARSAISPISGRGTLPSRAVSNSPLTASFFNGLMNALNSVP